MKRRSFLSLMAATPVALVTALPIAADATGTMHRARFILPFAPELGFQEITGEAVVLKLRNMSNHEAEITQAAMIGTTIVDAP